MKTEKQRSGYHHGDLRSALVEGARALVEERGVEGLSLREVARRVGVSRAAPYHHFKNKEAMAAAVAEDGFERLVECMDVAAADPVSELEACGRAYIEFALANPTLYRLMFGSKIGSFGEHPGLECAAKGAFGLLVKRLERASPSDELAPEARAMAVWGTVHGMASLIIDELGPIKGAGPERHEEWVAAAIRLVGSGVLRPASEG